MKKAGFCKELRFFKGLREDGDDRLAGPSQVSDLDLDVRIQRQVHVDGNRT